MIFKNTKKKKNINKMENMLIKMITTFLNVLDLIEMDGWTDE